MAGHSVKLGYWAIRGLGQPIRLLLEYTGTPYEERRYSLGPAPEYSREDWLSEKFALGLTFPNLPYLIDGEVKLTQTVAILKYIGRKHGLCGSTEVEQAVVDMCLGEIVDWKESFVSLCYGSDFKQEKEKYISALPTWLDKFEKFLSDKTWLAGNNLSVADFFLYELLDVHRYFLPDYLAKYPVLTQYHKKFGDLPAIKAYRASPKFIERPINNLMAAFH